MNDPIIVIGGGHNGLTAATYLARTRRPVILCEARSVLGGLASRDDFLPGYSTPGLLHNTSGVRPWILKDLGLHKHGLCFAKRPPITTLVSAHRKPIYLNEAGLSGDLDAELSAQYLEFRSFIQRIRPTVLKLMDTKPLAPLGPLLSLVGPALNIRRLGAHDLTELIRIPPMCAADWMRDSFDDERVGSALIQEGLLGTWLGPWSPWSAANLLLHQCVHQKPIEGGAPALIQALKTAAEAAGVQIRTQTQVKRIIVDNDQVTAVELVSGERIQTNVVCSTVNPVKTGLEMVGYRYLSSRFAESLQRVRMRGTTAFVHLAVNKKPLDSEGKPIEALRICHPLDDTEKAFDPIKYGQMSKCPLLDIAFHDDTSGVQCPPGHGVLSIAAQYAPYDLIGGWTEMARSALFSRIMEQLENVIPGIADAVVGHKLIDPSELETEYGLLGGHIFHGEHAPDQLLFMRPTIDSSHYKTPINGLFFGGSGSHPGGGITCVPGALAAQAIMDE